MSLQKIGRETGAVHAFRVAKVGLVETVSIDKRGASQFAVCEFCAPDVRTLKRCPREVSEIEVGLRCGVIRHARAQDAGV